MLATVVSTADLFAASMEAHDAVRAAYAAWERHSIDTMSYVDEALRGPLEEFGSRIAAGRAAWHATDRELRETWHAAIDRWNVARTAFMEAMQR